MKITAYSLKCANYGIEYYPTKKEAVNRRKFYKTIPIDDIDEPFNEKDYPIEKVTIDLDKEAEKGIGIYDILETLEKKEKKEDWNWQIWFYLPYLTSERNLPVAYITNIVYSQIQYGNFIINNEYHRQVDLPGGLTLIYDRNKFSWFLYDDDKAVAVIDHKKSLDDFATLVEGLGLWAMVDIVKTVCEYLGIKAETFEPDTNADLPF